MDPGPSTGPRVLTRSRAALARANLANRVVEPQKQVSWNQLAVEIQYMILNELAAIVPEQPYWRKRFFKAADYINVDRWMTTGARKTELWWLQKEYSNQTTRSKLATVCLQWQHFFEKLNFGHMILHKDDIDFFGLIMERQRFRTTFVHWIYLRIELSNYDCQQCSRREPTATNKINSIIFENAVKALFPVLSTWDPATCRLTLELGAYSPGDAQHFARELNDRIADNTHDSFRYTGSKAYRTRVFTNDVHKFYAGRSQLPQSHYNYRAGVASRVFGHDAGLGFPNSKALQGLGPVPIIEQLVIRRQFYRCFSYTSIKGLTDPMTRLKSIRYESWAGIKVLTEHLRRQDLEQILRNVIGRKQDTLRSVSIYGCTSNLYHCSWSLYDRVTHMPVGMVEHNILELSKILAEETLQLEEIHGARTICAEGFFDDFFPKQQGSADAEQPTTKTTTTTIQRHRPMTFLDWVVGDIPQQQPYWPNLTHLSLTSTHLDQPRINKLLTAAGKAAMRMPSLKMMELWNYHPNSRAIFRYSSNQGGQESGHPEIELITSWAAPVIHSIHDVDRDLVINNQYGRPMRQILDKETRSAWSDVARYHCHDVRDLKIRQEVWDREVQWGGCVIRHLRMRERILMDVSFEQLEMEGFEAPT